jgi:plasmid stabilization system protein ParE
MPRSIRYHPLFETDVIDAAAWYDARHPMIGSAFVDEVSRAVDQLTQHPERRSVVDFGVRLLAGEPFSVRRHLRSPRA